MRRQLVTIVNRCAYQCRCASSHANLSENHRNVAASVATGDALQKYAQMHWDDSIGPDDPYVLELLSELEKGSRFAIARSITLVESTNPTKRAMADRLLAHIGNRQRVKYARDGAKSMIFRIGISGSPGVGKSTFIETMGMKLVHEDKKRVAVLTIDPSGNTTGGQRVSNWNQEKRACGGSILGDLTRMERLSRESDAFIRQSPTSGTLGGVTRGTHEAVMICEAAGYDIVIIETVGVGQSEATVADMVDMFVLLLSPAHGDELQGIKRGIMELTDLIVITKADGDLAKTAQITQGEYQSALGYMHSRSGETWEPKVLRASSMTGMGIPEVWEAMSEFWTIMNHSGQIRERRLEQRYTCMWKHVNDVILHMLATHPVVSTQLPEIERLIIENKITPGQAAERLLRSFLGV